MNTMKATNVIKTETAHLRNMLFKTERWEKWEGETEDRTQKT